MDKPTTAKGGRSRRGRGGRSDAPPRGTKVTSTGARGSSSSSASKKRTRLVLEVARFEDYRAVAEQLQGGAGDVPLDADVFGVLIGCSGHSPVPAHLVDKVAEVLHREVVLRRGVSVIWGGGDPCFRFKTRGGNVADIAHTLLRLQDHHHHHRQGHVATSSSSAADARPGLLIGAVQRDDYAAKVPAFEKVVVAYHASLAQLGGRPTFGGFETAAAAVPPAYREFLASLRREVAQEGEEEEEDASNKRQRTVGTAAGTKGADPAAEAHTSEIATIATSKKRSPISGQFLPPEGLYPMAASAGYLSLLPALLGARELVLMVVPTAGTITLQEVTYTQLLIEHLAKQQGGQAIAPPVHIYAVTWPDMEAHLQPGEKNGRCKLLAIMSVLRALHARFPSNVHFLAVAE